jgi:hypothetical protein
VAWALRGAVLGVLATYPMAALCALFFRFPVPFGGYVSGPSGAVLSPLAVTIYGVMFGGFVVQGVLGGIAGRLARRRGRGNQRLTWRLCILYGAAASLPGVALLATLDKVIGPW